VLWPGAPPEVDLIVTIVRPAPRKGEALVRIKASGVNPLDIKIRSGSAPHVKHPPPAVLGLDLAGVETPGKLTD
jgi:NADPH2:quinone reductase